VDAPRRVSVGGHRQQTAANTGRRWLYARGQRTRRERSQTGWDWREHQADFAFAFRCSPFHGAVQLCFRRQTLDVPLSPCWRPSETLCGPCSPVCPVIQLLLPSKFQRDYLLFIASARPVHTGNLCFLIPPSAHCLRSLTHGRSSINTRSILAAVVRDTRKQM
jgi:hypothetical protein